MSLTVLINNTTHSFSNKSFFHSPKYIQTNHSLPLIHFLLLDQDFPIAQIYFTEENNKAHSTKHTSFGGFEFLEAVTHEQLSFFISKIDTYFSKHKFTQVSITLAPDCYSSLNIAMQHRVLNDNSFLKTNKELNYHLNTDSSIPYRKNLAPSEKNKLNKAQKAGFHSKKLPIEFFDSCFDLVVKNRDLKGFPVTISKQKLLLLVSTFTEFHLFGIYDIDKLIATSISIQVTPSILYNFYMADDYNYRGYSPLVMLNNFIYNWCAKNNISTLDLGTVSQNGVVNTGLENFKKHLGGIKTDKRTYSKSLIIA